MAGIPLGFGREGVLGDDGCPFVGGADVKVRAQIEALFRLGLKQAFQRGAGFSTPVEDEVAAVEHGADLREA